MTRTIGDPALEDDEYGVIFRRFGSSFDGLYIRSVWPLEVGAVVVGIAASYALAEMLAAISTLPKFGCGVQRNAPTALPVIDVARVAGAFVTMFD